MIVSFSELNLFIVAACVVICLLVCVYNLYYARKMRQWDAIRAKKSGAIRSRLIRYQAAGDVDGALRYLIRRIRRPEYLIALCSLRDVEASVALESTEPFDALIRTAISGVCGRYLHADVGEVGYLVKQIERFRVRSGSVNAFLLSLLKRKSSVRLVILAMGSIAVSSNEETLLEAITYCANQQIQCSDKLITDTLLGYTGNQDSLSQRLMSLLPSFREGAQRAIINYWTQVRYTQVQEAMLRLLTEDTAFKEARIGAARYFGAIYDERAMHAMVALMREDQWEMNVNCAKALAQYHHPEVTAVLRHRLQDRNWYVRHNCAMTLVGQNPRAARKTMEKLEDPYARDIMAYALERSEKKENQPQGGDLRVVSA